MFDENIIVTEVGMGIEVVARFRRSGSNKAKVSDVADAASLLSEGRCLKVSKIDAISTTAVRSMEVGSSNG